jgi:hypothetical protein
MSLTVQRGLLGDIGVALPYRGVTAKGANIGKMEIRLTEGLPPEIYGASDGVKPQ